MAVAAPVAYQVIFLVVEFQFPLEPVIAEGVSPADIVSSTPHALVPAGGITAIETNVPEIVLTLVAAVTDSVAAFEVAEFTELVATHRNFLPLSPLTVIGVV